MHCHAMPWAHASAVRACMRLHGHEGEDVPGKQYVEVQCSIVRKLCRRLPPGRWRPHLGQSGLVRIATASSCSPSLLPHHPAGFVSLPAFAIAPYSIQRAFFVLHRNSQAWLGGSSQQRLRAGAARDPAAAATHRVKHCRSGKATGNRGQAQSSSNQGAAGHCAQGVVAA